jgi:hypothetical protein
VLDLNQKLTMIDSRAPSVGGPSLPLRAASTVEQIKQLLGIDLVELVKTRTATGAGGATPPTG